MALATKTKRVRITKEEIEKARQGLLAQDEKPVRARTEKERPKWQKDSWYGLVYCDSYGHAWITGKQFKSVHLGKTDELIPYLKSRGIDGENVDSVLIAAEEFRSEKETPSCHLATKNDEGGINTSVENSNRATFRDNPQFLSLLDALIDKGYGIPTIQQRLKGRGYNVAYRTLGRWVNKRKAGVKTLLR